ncbi:GNAT family N-acetyltransferase [Pseudorhodoferax sp. LjRoot39]|uniref:GNAT family N-acetyltransferase n=1 Tax=Pseudorhodoferax sp. LjRoot39 TaxID=3342328 RepID=UPI003ED12F86
MSAADLPCVMAIQAEAYAAADFAPEQPAVFHDRMALAPGLCLVACDAAGAVLGYLLSHPWLEGAPPTLHSALGRLPPAANCWYLHDCAVAARAHGQGMAAALYAPALAQARAQGLVHGALVAVGDAAGYWERLGYRARALGAGRTKLAAYGAGARYMVRALD